MPRTIEYHRPASLDAALMLLQQPGVRTVPLAGGSWLAPHLQPGVPGSIDDSVDAVVDLAGLGLRYVERRSAADGDLLCLGAMATLAELAEHADCRQLAGGLLAEAVRREAPLNLRNAATIGGCIGRADPESEVLLALLALAAYVQIESDETRLLPLLDVLVDPAAAIGQGLISEVRLPWPAASVGGGLARVARTPADAAIVAAAAVSDGRDARLAIGGVTRRPLLLRLGSAAQVQQALAAALVGAELLADFRGSAEYRQAMAPVVARRALAQAAAQLAGM